jgi:hypothetical protein
VPTTGVCGRSARSCRRRASPGRSAAHSRVRPLRAPRGLPKLWGRSARSCGRSASRGRSAREYRVPLKVPGAECPRVGSAGGVPSAAGGVPFAGGGAECQAVGEGARGRSACKWGLRAECPQLRAECLPRAECRRVPSARRGTWAECPEGGRVPRAECAHLLPSRVGGAECLDLVQKTRKLVELNGWAHWSGLVSSFVPPRVFKPYRGRGCRRALTLPRGSVGRCKTDLVSDFSNPQKRPSNNEDIDSMGGDRSGKSRPKQSPQKADQTGRRTYAKLKRGAGWRRITTAGRCPEREKGAQVVRVQRKSTSRRLKRGDAHDAVG